MEDVSEIFFMYVPFAPAGFAFWTAPTNAKTFSSSFAAVKDALPRPA
jgi:hypothetical protein